MEYTVSQLSQIIKFTLEETFSNICVRGEISGLKITSSGYSYFNLKDKESLINCVIWRKIELPFKLEDGLEVVIEGSLSTYHARSNYQINVRSIKSAGIGALLEMLNKRKLKLQAEGLFDKKQPIPYLPKSIGIITSPTGAVIKDILHRISDRFPVKIYIWGVAVQGNGAAEQVANAIEGFNNQIKPDLIIVARGGGSIEDLWPFNEEVVVRAVANSKIPIISAIGHETDVTLIDFAADLRAPTPTAAAEFAVPKISDIKINLNDLHLRLNHSIHNLILKRSLHLNQVSTKLKEFTVKLTHLEQQIELKALSLKTSMNKMLYQAQINLEKLSYLLSTKIESCFERNSTKLKELHYSLNNYNHSEILKRGYSIVKHNNQIINKKSQVKNFMELSISVSDGSFFAIASQKSSNSKKQELATQSDMFFE